jgi:hypothetical protein
MMNWSAKMLSEPGFYWLAEAGMPPFIVEVGVESDSSRIKQIFLPCLSI